MTALSDRIARFFARCPGCGKRGRIFIAREVLTEPLPEQGGLMRVTTSCGWCKTRHLRDVILPRIK